MDYGMNDQGLPVIVVYPEYDTKEGLLSNGALKPKLKELWNNLPVFRDSLGKVPTLHVPMKKELIRSALVDADFMLATKTTSQVYRYG
nr:hypothetical protein [Rhizobium ruizarguesonis]